MEPFTEEKEGNEEASLSLRASVRLLRVESVPSLLERRAGVTGSLSRAATWKRVNSISGERILRGWSRSR